MTTKTPKTKEVYKQIAYQSYSGEALNPDLIIENLNIDYTDYEKILIDEKVTQNLRIAKAYPWDFPFGLVENENIDKKIVEYLTPLFDSKSEKLIDLQIIFDSAVDADFYGYSVFQNLFENRELAELIEFAPKHFTFNPKGDLLSKYTREIIEYADGKNYSFIIVRNTNYDNNFYGTGLCQVLYYLRELRKILLKNIDIASRKYGVTPYIALTQMTDKTEYDKAAEIINQKMESLRSGGAATLNGVIQITPLSNTLSIDDLWSAYENIGKVITGVVNGSTDTIESNEKGSYARAYQQNEVVRMVQNIRLKMIEKAVNQLIRRMVDIRFGTEYEAPAFRFKTGTDPSFEDLIKAIETGIDIDRSLLDKYIGKNPEDANKSTLELVKKYKPEQAQPLQFAENSKKKILNLKI